MTSVQMRYQGCLLGLTPVPLFFAGDPRRAIEKSVESSRTTHGAHAADVVFARYIECLLGFHSQ